MQDIGKAAVPETRFYSIMHFQYKEGAEIDTDPHLYAFLSSLQILNEEVDEFIGSDKGIANS